MFYGIVLLPQPIAPVPGAGRFGISLVYVLQFYPAKGAALICFIFYRSYMLHSILNLTANLYSFFIGFQGETAEEVAYIYELCAIVCLGETIINRL